MWYNIKNADALIWFGFSKTDILIFQNSLIGFFDFNSSPQPPGFIQFYYASIRLLEKSKLILMNCMTNYYDVYKLGLASFSKFLRMHSRVFTFFNLAGLTKHPAIYILWLDGFEWNTILNENFTTWVWNRDSVWTV